MTVALSQRSLGRSRWLDAVGPKNPASALRLLVRLCLVDCLPSQWPMAHQARTHAHRGMSVAMCVQGISEPRL